MVKCNIWFDTENLKKLNIEGYFFLDSKDFRGEVNRLTLAGLNKILRQKQKQEIKQL